MEGWALSGSLTAEGGGGSPATGRRAGSDQGPFQIGTLPGSASRAGQGHWCESLRILKAGDGWDGGFPPSRLLFLELLFFGPTCADDSAVQRLAL